MSTLSHVSYSERFIFAAYKVFFGCGVTLEPLALVFDGNPCNILP